MKTEIAGITRANEGIQGISWNILGQTYVPKNVTEHSFSWHAGESGETLGVHLDQRSDDFEHVAARGEIATGAGHDDGLDFFIHRAGAEEIGELAIALESQRILSLRPVQRHGGDAVDHGEQEMLWRIIRQRQRDGIG